MEYSDIIFPGDNLQEFIPIAEKLNYRRLFVCSKDKSISSAGLHQHKSNNINKSQIEIITSEFARVPQTTKKGFTVYSANHNMRLVMESGNIDVMYGAEELEKRDRLHCRMGGLNHILCKLARENNIIIAFSFSSLLSVYCIKRSIILGRMRQNIRLCRRYNNLICLASFATKPYDMRSPLDLMAFGALIGMHPSEAKKAIFIDR